MTPTRLFATIDTDGLLCLPPGLLDPDSLRIVASPESLARGCFTILDRPAAQAIAHRIARLKRSGMMPVAQTLMRRYQTGALSCRHDAATGCLTLPHRIVQAFAPLPCEIRLTRDDGPLVVQRLETSPCPMRAG